MPTRILIVGGGGREHALAWKLAASPASTSRSSRRAATRSARAPRVRVRPSVDPLDPGGGRRRRPARARSSSSSSGPEAPLAAGVADALRAPASPSSDRPRRPPGSRRSQGVLPRGRRGGRASAMADAAAFAGRRPRPSRPRAPSPSSGARRRRQGGRARRRQGRRSSTTRATTPWRATSPALPRRAAGDRAGSWSRSASTGREASVIAICDGRDAVALPAARDHKRLCDGDDGPEHRRDGRLLAAARPARRRAVDDVLATVHRPILAELARRGHAVPRLPVRGPDAHRRRPGAPRVQRPPRRPRGAGDPAAAGRRARAAPARGRARRAGPVAGAPARSLPVAARGGGRDRPRRARAIRARRGRGDPIDGLEAAGRSGALVFHAGTTGAPDGGFGTNGGRVSRSWAAGRTSPTRATQPRTAADAISWDGLQRRHDIAVGAPAARPSSEPRR